MNRLAQLFAPCCIILVLCIDSCLPNRGSEYYHRAFSFVSGTDGWEAGFSDFRPEQEALMSLHMNHASLPEYLGPDLHGLNLRGYNHSADLFMFVKRRIDHFEAQKTYDVMFEVEIASNAREQAFGIGGSPGSGVYLKAAASAIEPCAVLDGTSLRMNIDKGIQAQSGSDGIMLGTIGIPDNTPDKPYRLKRLGSTAPLTVTADTEGAIWFLIGVDAAFEGKTDIFIHKIVITATPHTIAETN